jgi:hypothetical protein
MCPDGTNSTAKATICDKALRTVNRGVDCGAADDWYYYSPWRHPGDAPVFDSCGMAGGHKPPNGGFGGIYVNTTHAKLGDKGTEVLPATPSGATWKAGDSVEVAWTIEANHAGGYQYRLCPADSKLDEDCFQKTPLGAGYPPPPPHTHTPGSLTFMKMCPIAILFSYNGDNISLACSP